MSYRFILCERRDNADRVAMANTALAICREVKKSEGIVSAKYYWSGPDKIAFLVEGEPRILNGGVGAANPVEMGKLLFTLSDLSRQTMDIILADPGLGAQAYQNAGR